MECEEPLAAKLQRLKFGEWIGQLCGLHTVADQEIRLVLEQNA